jgi:uncharacterized protein
MKLHVDRLTDSPVEYRSTVSPEWLRERLDDSSDPVPERVESPEFDFTACRVGRDILLEGRFEAVLDAECGRCLRRYRQPLRDAWRLVLEPAGERTPPDPEGVEMLGRDGLCLAEEIELGWYRGKTLELDAFFGEVVALAMPLQPLCREDCAGLCPRCGIDLNQESCSCSEMNPDSPFAALAALKQSEGST